MLHTIQAAANLSANIDALLASNDRKAKAFAAAKGFTIEELRYGALRRSADFPSPRFGADLYLKETFPAPSMGRGYLRSYILRTLGLEG